MPLPSTKKCNNNHSLSSRLRFPDCMRRLLPVIRTQLARSGSFRSFFFDGNSLACGVIVISERRSEPGGRRSRQGGSSRGLATAVKRYGLVRIFTTLGRKTLKPRASLVVVAKGQPLNPPRSWLRGLWNLAIAWHRHNCTVRPKTVTAHRASIPKRTQTVWRLALERNLFESSP